MKELTLDAAKEKLPEVLAFVDSQLEAAGCPMKPQIEIDVAVEELFVNIASYAYGSGQGTATIQVTLHEETPLSVEITFIDHGTPYNPLSKPDPDVSLPAKQRKKGGLGIFMVKKSMDDITYEYKDGCNILSIKKILV